MFGIESLNPDARARVELIDLGCGDGGSLDSATRRFAVEGIGLDRDERFVKRGREQGRPVFQVDVFDLEPEDLPAVKYVMLDNVLEHMPDLGAVEEVLGQACRLASRVVHVRHPSFEDEEYLASVGLKEYWTDWPSGPNAHTAHVRLHEFAVMAARLGIYRMRIDPVMRLVDSSDPGFLPMGAPSDQTIRPGELRGVYDERRHGPKPFIEFDRPVYYAFDLLFFTRPGDVRVSYWSDPETDPGRPFITWQEPGADDADDAQVGSPDQPTDGRSA